MGMGGKMMVRSSGKRNFTLYQSFTSSEEAAKSNKLPHKKKPRTSKNGKRISKPKYTSYVRYIYRILPKKTRISSKAMKVIDSFVNDIFDRLASEAGRVTSHAGQKTISSQAMIAAVKLQLPKEFAAAAIQCAAKAMCTYQNSLETLRRK